MEPTPFDDHSGRGPAGGPGVRLTLGSEPADRVRLWYGTFDAILRLLYDLWWTERRIGRLRLLDDWVADRGVFDPEPSPTLLSDPEQTRAALLLARERLARRADPGDSIDPALVAFIRCLDSAIEAREPVRVERIHSDTDLDPDDDAPEPA